MQALLALEILKVRRTRRAQALLLLLTVGPLLMTALVPIASMLSQGVVKATLAGLVPVFGLSLMANGFVLWPLALLILSADLWSGEQADRTLRTLVLTQASRRRVLAARLAVTVGLALLAWVVFGALLLADLAAARLVIATRLPELSPVFTIALHRVAWGLAVYTVPLTLGFLCLATFFTIASLLAASVAGVLINTATLLVALWWILPQLITALGYTGSAHEWLFTHQWASLYDRQLMLALVGHPDAKLDAWRPATGLLLNLLVLLPIADRLWRRKELHDA